MDTHETYCTGSNCAATSQNVISDICAQWRIRSVCAVAQSDQIPHSTHLESRGTNVLYVDNGDSNQHARTRARPRRLIWVYVGCTSEGMFSHVEMLLDVFLIWHIGIYYVLQKSCYWNNKYGILNKGLKKQGIRMNSFLRIPKLPVF